MVMNTGKHKLYSMEVIFSDGRDPELPEQGGTDDENDLCSLIPHNHMRLRYLNDDNVEAPIEMFLTHIPETDEWKVNQPYTDEANQALKGQWLLQRLIAGGGTPETLADGSQGFAIDPSKLIEILGGAQLDAGEIAKKKKKEDDYAGGFYL